MTVMVRMGGFIVASTLCGYMLLAGSAVASGPQTTLAAPFSRVHTAAFQTEAPIASAAITDLDEGGEDVIKDGEEGSGEPIPLLDFSPSGMLENTQPSAIEIDRDVEPPFRIGSYFYFHHRAGGQMGQSLPYSVLGAFQPINLENGVAFGVAQFVLDNNGNPGGSLTWGRRWYQERWNRVCGISGSYDLHRTHYEDTLQQFALNLESRGDRWDCYLNGYLPTSTRSRAAGLSIANNLRFDGNNVVRDVLDVSEAAMGGLDMHLARRLSDRNLWAYAGWYHFQGEDAQTYGVSGGLHGYLLDRLAVDLTLTDDPLFGTNLGINFSFFFGGTSSGLVSPSDVYSRMGEPVNRRETVAVNEVQIIQAAVPLTSGGVPITVTHVNDAGIAIGTGTAADPFGSLVDAAGSATDIVYVHADSNFSGQQYTLATTQRVLGEADGIDHMIQTDQLGQISLPRATAGTNRPVIDNAAGNAITAAPDSEVSALDIRNAGGQAVFADNTVTGLVSINRTAVSGGDGLQVNNSLANFRFEDLDITNTVAAGIQLNNINGDVVVDGGMIANSGGAGIVVTDVGTLLIQNVDIQTSIGPAVRVEVSGNNTTDATVQNNVLSGNGTASSFGFGVNAGATLNLNLIGNEDSLGFDLERDPNGQLRLGGVIGVGGFFDDDNGNVTNNGNRTGFGAPNVIISGAGNQIQIVDPLTIPAP